MVLLEIGRIFVMWGLAGGAESSGGIPPKEAAGLWPLPSSLFSFLDHKVSDYALQRLHSGRTHYLAIGPKQQDQSIKL